MVEKKCYVCGIVKPHYAKGKCFNCYWRLNSRKYYWSNPKYREKKKQRMREYSQRLRILSGQTNTLSFGIYLRKKLGVL